MNQSVKLSKLRLSASNVRTAPDAALMIEPFAADLEARGVLQNLLVTPVARSRGMFEVFDGGRRLRALNLLVERGVIDPDQYDVPVRVLKGNDAELTETSLAVSFHHLKLSPTEECRAFQHFLAGSTDIDAVAKRFGVTRRFIDGRLRLADLAEPIFTALAENRITLDMAKAYASTASHEAQLSTWTTYGSMSHYNADSIRRIIANDMMRADDPVALLVGAEAYEAAGGVIERDLFSDAREKWRHPEIARGLAAAIMEAEATRIGAERGLAWIRPVASHSIWDATRNLYKITLPEQPMTLAEAERAEQIEQRMGELHDAMQDEDLAEDAFAVMETELDALAAELEALDNRPVFMPPELASRVGAFLTLAQNGTMLLNESYYSETPITVTVVEPDPVDGDAEGGHADDEGEIDAEAVSDPVIKAPTFRIEEGTTTTSTGSTPKEIDPDTAAPGGKALSQVLLDQLAVQRRDVLGAALIANPGLALDYMLFAMVDGRTMGGSGDGTTISASRPQDPVMSNNVPASRARDYLAEVHDGLDTSWGVPGGKVERFEAFRALGDEAKSAWLAWIVATSLEAKENYSSHTQNPLQNRLATILEVDVASWWRPTSENFFDRVSKGSLISLLHEVGGPALSSRHATEKKPEVSASCQKLFAGEAIVEPAIKEAALQWLPSAMRFNDVATTAEAIDDEQGDLADLIDEGDGEAGAGAGDAGTDDLASLIGDEPEDDGTSDPQQDTEVDAEAGHDNDDGVPVELVAAE
ncbi:ParB/RepB/Spo0J family partition protein [Sphingomonas sanguinis]|jgi:ParB family chromosome partitioning protein|uniref:ParB N-terminal domain-containing protein n=1 Tax=Sphingomonas sanguinis TaxID=33051 RepID=A0A7Y7QYW6_9SPHN|nr:ParB/RepB/Spo0J family partition protein [Sphingomonas sanguinis]MBZ6383882.1 ParB N-terminal domain-containing protein [Sphingomonas sanguinis]NNG51402.1 ParB N-terminal domain-containing protein [Sphingomonas sanguinis]NVP33173.1 ParB N-terminal domain-containing protein [Sphingomonas sanguinis]